MEFHVTAAALTFIVIVLSGFFAYIEGRLTKDSYDYREAKAKQIHVVSFLGHGATYADAFICSLYNGFLFPHLEMPSFLNAYFTPIYYFGGLILICTIVSIFMHQTWAWHSDICVTHLFYRKPKTLGKWLQELSWSGYGHFIFFSVQMAIILATAVTPIPFSTLVLLCGLIIFGFIPLAVIWSGIATKDPNVWFVAGLQFCGVIAVLSVRYFIEI